MGVIGRLILMAIVLPISSWGYGAEREVDESTKIPKWIIEPGLTGTLSAADCVKSIEDEGLDGKLSIAGTRVTLARNITRNFLKLKKEIRKLENENEVDDLDYRLYIKVLIERIIDDAHVIHAEYVAMGGETKHCTLLRSDNALNKLFDVFAGTEFGHNLLKHKALTESLFLYFPPCQFDEELYKL